MKKGRKLKNGLFLLPTVIILVTVSIMAVVSNYIIQGYISKVAMQLIGARLEVLDTYYNDGVYEGYYTEETEFLMSVYHLIFDEKGTLLYPCEPWESEKEQQRTMRIAKAYKSNTGLSLDGKKGKLFIGEETYYVNSKIYTGGYDGFFVRKNIGVGEKKPYVVLACTNITPVEEFQSILNKVLMGQLCLCGLIALMTITGVAGGIDRSFERLKRYIIKAGNRETLTEVPSFPYREFNEVADTVLHMSEMIEKAEKTQEQFFQNISHELRTPLMSIQGYAEGILFGAVKDVDKAAEAIVKNSKKMAELVDEILYLSRIDASEHLNKEKFGLQELICRCLWYMKGEADKRGIEIIYRPGEEEIMLLGDEKMIERAVSNILSNALRYAKSKIILTSEEESSKVVVKVTDDGDGIDEADLPHIFERFYKGKHGKTGIGLAITAEAVRKHGGTICVQASRGATTFIIELPEDAAATN
ncbi:HAMP domain-containing sensor histidine kinase [Acetivibrio ethanolgignens]|uniref:histidine kinase n=1 Tax=Acetivibrio ethanolgignens TaxID=290052 RepID=A0A0V8QEE3_9FIRM|nr:HAMP domain-containing sensor histidine kinase [Acetivibrio ethanolgignens]KSV58961.1 hypothetical protein ASU35_10720 [Acetivibrio ethanolgignens]